MVKRRSRVSVRARVRCAAFRSSSLKRGRVVVCVGRADTRARRSYFSLETRGSYEALHSGSAGLALDSVQHLLRLYVEALTGREVDIAPLAAVPDEARIDDGRTIHLPSLVNEFGDEDLDFGSTKCWQRTLRDRSSLALTSVAACCAQRMPRSPRSIPKENVDALDAFALADEIVQLRKTTKRHKTSTK